MTEELMFGEIARFIGCALPCATHGYLFTCAADREITQINSRQQSVGKQLAMSFDPLNYPPCFYGKVQELCELQ